MVKAMRHWRTREDPLAGIWEAELLPLLEAEPGLQATTLFEELRRRHPGEYGDGMLLTLQRRVRAWHASFGAEKEIYFTQATPRGRPGLSDFTVCDSLGVTIGGEPFAHRLYQFALAYSGWRHAGSGNPHLDQVPRCAVRLRKQRWPRKTRQGDE
jgi:hypothetical protein